MRHVKGRLEHVPVPDNITGERLIGWLVGQGYLSDSDDFEYILEESSPLGLSDFYSKNLLYIGDKFWLVFIDREYGEDEIVAEVANKDFTGRTSFECRWHTAACLEEILETAMRDAGMIDDNDGN